MKTNIDYVALAAELEEANGMWCCNAEATYIDFYIGRLKHNGEQWVLAFNTRCRAIDGACMLRVIEGTLKCRPLINGEYTSDNIEELEPTT